MSMELTQWRAVLLKRGSPFVLLCLLVAGLGQTPCQARSKAKARVNQAQKDNAYRQLFQTVFTRWDRNHDGKLDLEEINAVIRNPWIHGNESAIATVLRRRLQPDDDNRTKSLTLAQVLALADDPKVQRIVTRHAWHVQAINRSLFLPSDPSLETFHQGGMGDCYFLAVVGAFVYHHPDRVRRMILPQTDGGFRVEFGDGRQVSVKPVTDAELLMGATEGRNHGIWLSVLEKAYAGIHEAAREKRTGKPLEPDEAVFSDLIGHGGYYGPVIKLLTGHRTASPPLGRWMKSDPRAGLERMHQLLARLSSEGRLMAISVRKDKTLPRGIHHGHVYAVLGYNASTGMVRMFNPWGNSFKPAGPPGLANGYPTRHGIFEVPLRDFVQMFTRLSYETDQPIQAPGPGRR